jgi:hypothetical protein
MMTFIKFMIILTYNFIVNDDNSYSPTYNYPIDRNLLKRSSPDITLDTRGKDLLDLCISHQIRVLNGRVLGDMLGHYT